jgi:hypothetical protein
MNIMIGAKVPYKKRSNKKLETSIMSNRKFTRFISNTPATFDIEGVLGHPKFYLNDASQGGLSFNAPACIKKGTHMNVELYENSTKIRAHIVWCNSSTHRKCKIGLVFQRNLMLSELDRLVT